MSFTIDNILGNVLPCDPAQCPQTPTTSSLHPCQPVIEAEGTSSEQEVCYFGRKDKSKFGKNDVLIYTIPGSNSRCYSFSLKRKNNKYDSYYCIGCHKNGKGVRIDVIKDEFMTDPCMLPHVCLPRDTYKDRASRFTYEKLLGIKNNPREAIRGPRQHWQEALVSIPSMDGFSDGEQEKVEDHFFGAGPSQRRHAFSRSVNSHRDRNMTMENVAPDLAVLSNGIQFLQEACGNMHIYFSKETVRSAVECGLHTIVADGVHSFQPKKLGRSAQVYCMHGVCRGGFDVPLLFAITPRKTEETYVKVFTKLKECFDEIENFTTSELNVVLDFEKAAIRAVSTVLCIDPQGCSFHLTRCWTRKRDSLGLRQYIRGSKRTREIARWWKIIKGLPFLPDHLRSYVAAIRRPPVPATHPAHKKCKEFLKYMKETWLSGLYANMWCKWGMKELRTTNLAESFNRKLGVILGCDHPDLRILVDEFHHMNKEAHAHFAT